VKFSKYFSLRVVVNSRVVVPVFKTSILILSTCYIPCQMRDYCSFRYKDRERVYVYTELKKTKTLSCFRYFLAPTRHNNCSYACIGVFGAYQT